MRRLRFLFSTLLLGTLVLGCVRRGPASAWSEPTSTPAGITIALTATEPTAAAVLTPTAAPAEAPMPTPAPEPTALPPDSGWQPLRAGLEQRRIELRDAQGSPLENLYLLRLDPGAYEFRAAYDPAGRTLENWLAHSGALIALNGGYYRVEGETLIPTGLTVIEGRPAGESYGDFAGMLAVGPGGADLRWLAQAPYDPAEGLTSAVQSFPLLVKPGGELGFPAELEDYQAARRTVIARDRAGRFLLLVAPRGYFTLHQLSAWLVQSDLELDIALNLDGGPSSGLLLADPPDGETALLPVPVVLLVFSR